MTLKRLQEQLGYFFKNDSLLLQALTHSSFGHEFLLELPYNLRNNERMEFLGDSILSASIASFFFETFPNMNEGEMTIARSELVNETHLKNVAKQIGLPDMIRLGKGEIMTGGFLKASILADALEAVLGAVYLDGGFEVAQTSIRKLFRLQKEKGPTF